jgi:hypothetical protein
MIITAKFSSICPKCSQSIRAGARVEWTKGVKATHATCPAPAAPRATSRASRREPNAEAGEKAISRFSTGRGDTYGVGDTLYLPRVSGGSGDGHWHTVVSAWIGMPNEDMGSYDWMCHALVRPATDVERTAAAARRTEAQRREALARLPGWIANQVRDISHCTEERVPAGSWSYSVRGTLAGSETLYVSEDAVWYVTSSYDDGPYTWRMPLTTEMVAGVCAMVEALSATVR